MKSKAIICDLDGTLIINPEWNGDLEVFYNNIEKGYPVEWCKILLNALFKDNIIIIFITARDEKCYDITKKQLDSWFDFDYFLYMRKKGDLRENYIIKEEHLDKILQEFNVLFCIDDSLDNCNMFKKYLPTLQIC